MKFKVELTDHFKKEAKRLLKKYPSLKNELIELFDFLEENPELGTSLGNNIYKIRLAISSKGKGKSGGARIITYVAITDETVLLLSIYNKSETENLSISEIQEILKKYL